MADDIEGWRVSLQSETLDQNESQTVEISGPGNLTIEIQRFESNSVAVEGFVNLEMDPPQYYKLTCSFVEVADNTSIYLDYYFTDEPEAYLIVGCAYWVLPRQFAQQLMHVFLLGDTSHSWC